MTQITTTNRKITVEEPFDAVIKLLNLNSFNGGLYLTEVQTFYPEDFTKQDTTTESVIWLNKSHIVEVKKFKS